MKKVRAHAYVSGEVQGVWYRSSAVQQAMRIGGLTGMARNMRDGRVEVICEGERAKVKQLIDWLWKGPELAEVAEVDVAWENATGEFENFDVAV